MKINRYDGVDRQAERSMAFMVPQVEGSGFQTIARSVGAWG